MDFFFTESLSGTELAARPNSLKARSQFLRYNPWRMRRRSTLLLFALLCILGCRARRSTSPASSPPAVRYLKGQLHLHSSRSADSHTSPAEVVRWYGEHGFDFIVFTDHNRAGLPMRSSAPLVFSGVELTQNLRDCTPPPAPGDQCLLHVNAVFVRPGVDGLDPWRPEVASERRAGYRLALAATAHAGGLAQLNHPNFHYAADAALLTLRLCHPLSLRRHRPWRLRTAAH